MTVGIVDTTVVVHYFRKNPVAQTWVDTQPVRLSIVAITWLEVMYGAGSKQKKSPPNQFSIASIPSIYQRLTSNGQCNRWNVSDSVMEYQLMTA
jgi:hypothetical protein